MSRLPTRDGQVEMAWLKGANIGVCLLIWLEYSTKKRIMLVRWDLQADDVILTVYDKRVLSGFKVFAGM